MQICPNCGEENPAKFRLCGFCGTPLAPAAPAQEVRKLVTILFCDLKGSTSLGERLDSESLRETMSRYFDAMSASITRHGGTIEKYIGDAVMAVFGLPRVHEDDALRAVRAARGMQDALAGLNEGLERTYGVTLENRIGVYTGEVVAGDSTTGQRLVTGDPVNTAARLEQAAGACEVLIGELTYRLVREHVDVEPVEPLELKGKAERVPAFRLLDVHDRQVSEAARSPLVGRALEEKQIADALDQVIATRACERVLLTGDAGVGKSRLVEHVCEAASERALVIRGRCLSYGNGITFWPLIEALREASGIQEADDLAAARAKLAGLLGEGNEEIFERLASAVGLSDRQYPIPEVFWAARKLVETLSSRRPLVLVFEDLHWAEPALLDLIDHVVETAEQAPALLLCVARPDLLEQRPAWEQVERLALAPLSGTESAQVIDNLLGDGTITDEARARIVAAADGNPLFVEQLLSMMIDEGLLLLEDGVWRTGELKPGWVPPTIQALLTARLDQLEREQRAVIDPASVIGHYFQQAALDELVEEFVRDQVGGRLDELAHKQFVRPESGNLYRFDHILIRDSVYDGLLKRARATLHERFVQWADRVNGDRATEFEEITGHHLEQAHRYLIELGLADEHAIAVGAEATRRLASAGRRAFVRGDMNAAANLLLRATSPLPPQDPRRLAIFPDLGEALMQLGEFEQAASLLEDAVATAELAGEPTLAANARLVRQFVGLLAGGTEGWTADATRAAEEAIALCEQEGDNVGLARASRVLGWIDGNACRYGAATAALERAIDYARLAGDVRQERRASTQYALMAVYGPTPVEDCIIRCEEVAKRVEGDRQAEAAVVCVLGQLEAMRGDFERARELYRKALATFEELGLPIDAAAVSLSSGRVELLAGDAASAERELRRGYDYFSRLGERYLLSSVAGLLAEAVGAQGRLDEAEALARETSELAAEDDVDAQTLWRLAHAKVLARRGELTEAERLVREAVGLLEPTDYVVNRVSALASLAGILLLGARDHEARELLEQARILALEKSSPVMLAELDVLDAELTRLSLTTTAPEPI
jgi:class 3 adenylate cyclase/tetratricopeptide (TPR) repeat protein